jgi:hypothetical protein
MARGMRWLVNTVRLEVYRLFSAHDLGQQVRFFGVILSLFPALIVLASAFASWRRLLPCTISQAILHLFLRFRNEKRHKTSISEYEAHLSTIQPIPAKYLAISLSSRI